MTRRDLAMNNLILRGVVGSTAHGTGIDGQEDRDEMGVCIEPPEYVCGLEKFEQYIHRTKPEGVRSEAGDLDLTVYSLRKFVRLAAQGNPSVLVLLWLPEYMEATILGRDLIELRSAFVSAESGRRFLGYLTSQKMRFTGERSKKVTRPELVERYGYDTKFAMHALRLGLQGIDYMTDRHIWMPIPEPNRSILLDVRHGRLSYKQVLLLIEGAETELRQLVEARDGDPGWAMDRARVNRFLVDAHRDHWSLNIDAMPFTQWCGFPDCGAGVQPDWLHCLVCGNDLGEVGVSKKRAKDGDWFELRLSVQPSDMPNELYGVPLGTRMGVAMVQIADDETETPVKPYVPKRAFAEMPPSQQAGVRCSDPAFQEWCKNRAMARGAMWPEEVSPLENTKGHVCFVCGVVSRAQFNTNEIAAKSWRDMNAQFEADTGRTAERRS